MKCSRIQSEPTDLIPARFSTTWDEAPAWPARWIHPPWHSAPDFWEFSADFTLENHEELRLHLTASERYRFFVDGVFCGEGPERGDIENWFYDSYRLELEKGPHVLRVDVLSLEDAAPEASLGAPTGMIAAIGNHPLQSTLNTGSGAWKCRSIDGWILRENPLTPETGHRFSLDWETYRKSRTAPLKDCAVGEPGRMKDGLNNSRILAPLLRPALLPAMIRRKWSGLRVRHACDSPPERNTLLVETAAHQPEIASKWSGLLEHSNPVAIPEKSSFSLILDAGNYLCAYPRIAFSGKATVTIRSAEALFESPPTLEHGIRHSPKGNRDEIAGKWFAGPGDVVVAEETDCIFEPLWWLAGRYWLISVETREQAATITHFDLIETRHPFEPRGFFNCGDAGFTAAWPILVRGLQTCLHDMFFDCPYYEQSCYIGDSRLQALSGWCLGAGNGPALKTLDLFAEAQLSDGLLPSRHPSRTRQVIAPFSLIWIGMLRDYMMWRDDPATVRRLAPVGRRILSSFEAALNANGLLGPMHGWNFIDWVAAPGWINGVPPGGLHGPSAPLHWSFVCGLRWMAEIERFLNETELESRWLRLRSESASAAEVFFDTNRNLYADDPMKQHFSDHAQALAILSGALNPGRETALAAGLVRITGACLDLLLTLCLGGADCDKPPPALFQAVGRMERSCSSGTQDPEGITRTKPLGLPWLGVTSRLSRLRLDSRHATRCTGVPQSECATDAISGWLGAYSCDPAAPAR